MDRVGDIADLRGSRFLWTRKTNVRTVARVFCHRQRGEKKEKEKNEVEEEDVDHQTP